jgi:hypothetical protein
VARARRARPARRRMRRCSSSVVRKVTERRRRRSGGRTGRPGGRWGVWGGMVGCGVEVARESGLRGRRGGVRAATRCGIEYGRAWRGKAGISSVEGRGGAEREGWRGVAHPLAALPDVTIGVLTRPQSGLGDLPPRPLSRRLRYYHQPQEDQGLYLARHDHRDEQLGHRIETLADPLIYPSPCRSSRRA